MTENAVRQPKVTRHIRLNFKSTIKEGWGYESTVTLDIEGEEPDGVEPLVRDHMYNELVAMNQLARNVAEREIRVRTQQPIDPLGPLPSSIELETDPGRYEPRAE